MVTIIKPRYYLKRQFPQVPTYNTYNKRVAALLHLHEHILGVVDIGIAARLVHACVSARALAHSGSSAGISAAYLLAQKWAHLQ